MVGLPLAHPKVARCAVRILVLTVRFATARRQATPPWGSPNQAVPRTHRSGGSLDLIGVAVGFPNPARQALGKGPGQHSRDLRTDRSVSRGTTVSVRATGTIKDGGGVGATGTMASLTATRALSLAGWRRGLTDEAGL